MMATVIGVAVAGGKTRLLTPEYDFGVLQEDQGAVTGSAFVVNDGPDTTYVRDVRPSCGCTGAEYSREPLAPGDTTEVWFTYNPVGRPGTIGKTVKIYMGDDDAYLFPSYAIFLYQTIVNSILYKIYIFLIIRLTGKQHIISVHISHITAFYCISFHNCYLLSKICYD